MTLSRNPLLWAAFAFALVVVHDEQVVGDGVEIVPVPPRRRRRLGPP